MIEWAQKQYPSFEYPNLQFQIGSFIESNFPTQFDIVVSCIAFQHCMEQSKGMDHMAKLLKQEGKLWIVTPISNNGAWKQTWKNIMALPKWTHYWTNILPRHFPTEEEFKELAEKANLQVFSIESIASLDTFVDREEFLQFLLGTFTTAVPKHLTKEFYNVIIDEYLRLSPAALRENGTIEARFGRVEFESRKP